MEFRNRHEQVNQSAGLDISNPEYQRSLILEQSAELLKPIAEVAAKI